MIKLEPIIPKAPFDSQHFINFATDLLGAAVEKMYKGLKTEPPNKYVPWSQIGGFVSDKQRKYVMRNIRRGVIEVPYRRSHKLSESWKLESKRTPGEITYIISNKDSVAKYVQSRPTQFKRQKIVGWPTVEDMIDFVWPNELAKIERAIAQYKPPTHPGMF